MRLKSYFLWRLPSVIFKRLHNNSAASDKASFLQLLGILSINIAIQLLARKRYWIRNGHPTTIKIFAERMKNGPVE